MTKKVQHPTIFVPSEKAKYLGQRLRHGLLCGQLPKGCGWVKTTTDSLRVAIEEEVLQRNEGEISLFQAAAINTAIRWERHALLCQRWLRVELDNLSPEQKLNYSKEIANASRNRDKALRELGIHQAVQKKLVDALYTFETDTSTDSESEKAAK